MAELGVMIEAQEGLDWEHWRRIASCADRLGFAALRTSDHCFSVLGVEGRHSLAAWPALALAAEWTERIQIGPMVSPMTFYQPAVLARQARAVDELSGGRLILGVGTGWYEREHEDFGIDFPSLKERFDRLEAGIDRIKRTLGEHPLPLLIGGGGERRALRLVAQHAAEWNFLTRDADAYRAKAAVLAEHCRKVGRDPAQIRRSVMNGFIVGRDDAELKERAARFASFMPSMDGMSAEQLLEATRTAGRMFVGTPDEVVDQMTPLVREGVELFMLQHFLLDDDSALELLASDVMPKVRAL